MLLDSSKRTCFAYLRVLTGLFAAILLVADALNCTIIWLGRLPMTGGLILFPVLVLSGDVLTEI